MTSPDTSTTTDAGADLVPVVSQDAIDSLMGTLTGLIAAANTPEAQQAQVLLLQRLALQGSVVPSRIPAPANITQVGGYLNLLTDLGQDDMRTQMLGAALGLAGSTPLPGLGDPAPALALTALANDRPAGDAGATVPATVTLRSDLAPALTAVLDSLHAAGGLLPLLTPAALPPAGTTVPFDLLTYLGRAALVAPTAATVAPATDPVVLGHPAAAAGDPFRLAVRVQAGTTGADTGDWTCLFFDQVAGAFGQTTVSGAALLPLDAVLSGSGLQAPAPGPAPAGRGDLTWARIAAPAGLVPGVTRFGDELGLVRRASEISASALATMVDWTWNGSRFVP
jgi:hypothetical protein